MAKLPSSFRETNRTSRNFRDQYAKLPEQVRRAVRDSAKLFHKNPAHRSLRRHALTDNKRGQHQGGSFSVTPTAQYRAIYVVVDGINVWYWIGTHAEYDTFTGG